MKKTVLILLSLITLANLVVLVLALTQPASPFYPYRLLLGITLIVFGAYLRRHILKYREDSKE